MNKTMRMFILVMVGFILLACSFGNFNDTTEIIASPPPANQVTEAPAAVEPSPLPSTTLDTAEAPPTAELEPCSLVTTAEVESILAEPASAPGSANGGCNFTNAKDSLYAFSVGAAQDQQTNGILQGQAMLLGFAGVPLDDARMANIKTLAAALDYKGFFSELVAASEGVPTLKVQLVEDSTSDVVYWAWITAQSRRQGAYVAVRGPTLISINLVVADTQSEESMLAASSSLASKIFERLPPKFTLAMPTAVPMPTEIPTAIPTPTLVGLAAPGLVAPADGIKFNIYPRTTTLEWIAVPGASKYVVEIIACNAGNSSVCFPLELADQSPRETQGTTYTFNFVGDQPGQWRVWAVDGNGQAGSISPWWNFTYKK